MTIVFVEEVDADTCRNGDGLDMTCVLSATKLSMNYW